jgi:hypothetical protein
MGIFSRLQKTKTQREVEQIFEDVEANSEKMLKPVLDAGLSIVNAAKTCCDKVKSKIDHPDEAK